jgi:hypothetical protein
VNPLGTAAMRKSFVNCSRGEAARINLPADLAALPWPDLDFAGWRDPKAPQRAYLVAPRPDGTNLGLVLRTQAGRNRRSLVRNSMCSICLTVHTASGVSLFAAPRPGAAGRDGNTVGSYCCSDLKCSLYARGILRPETTIMAEETLTVSERVIRLQNRLEQFLASVTASGTG